MVRETFSGGTRSAAEVRVQGAAGASGLDSDEGGRLSAYRFTKDQGSVNLFPQDSNFNRAAFKTIENDYARATAAGNTVYFSHELGDFDATGRPGTVTVRYRIVDPSGRVITRFDQKFPNASGQRYERQVR